MTTKDAVMEIGLAGSARKVYVAADGPGAISAEKGRIVLTVPAGPVGSGICYDIVRLEVAPAAL